jgi:hypothetical protein
MTPDVNITTDDEIIFDESTISTNTCIINIDGDMVG